MEFEIDEADLAGFNEEAKKNLKKVSLQYITNMIKESYRIESSYKSTNSGPEVTSSIVDSATVYINNGLSNKKKIKWKIIKILAVVLGVVVGVLYDAEKLKNEIYLLIFIFLIVAVILTTTISVMKEE